MKKVIQLPTFLEKNLEKPNRKPNKIWVGKGSKFCNRSMKSWLQDKNIQTYMSNAH